MKTYLEKYLDTLGPVNAAIAYRALAAQKLDESHSYRALWEEHGDSNDLIRADQLLSQASNFEDAADFWEKNSD